MWILGAKLESENGQVGPKSRLGPKYGNFLKDSLCVKKKYWEKLRFWSHLGADLAKKTTAAQTRRVGGLQIGKN